MRSLQPALVLSSTKRTLFSCIPRRLPCVQTRPSTLEPQSEAFDDNDLYTQSSKEKRNRDRIGSFTAFDICFGGNASWRDQSREGLRNDLLPG